MLRTLALALACVLVAAPPALAKKRHAAAHGHAHAAKKHKGTKPLVRVQKTPPPTRVAAIEQHAAPAIEQHATPPPEVSAPPPSPPVQHGPLGPQAGDDEVPGSRMKR